MEFFLEIKIRSTPSFGWEVKPEVPCRKISLEVFQILIGKIRTHSSIPPLRSHMTAGWIARELWWTSQEFSLAGIIIFHGCPRSHITLRMISRSIGGRGSETQSHPIIINQSIGYGFLRIFLEYVFVPVSFLTHCHIQSCYSSEMCVRSIYPVAYRPHPHILFV
jgi:hypothetical protein